MEPHRYSLIITDYRLVRIHDLFFAVNERANTLDFQERLDQRPACFAASACEENHGFEYNQLYRKGVS